MRASRKIAARIQGVEEKAEGAGQQQEGDEAGCAPSGDAQNRRIRPPRRPVHDAVLDGFEGQRQTEKYGGGHVDPQDLQKA